MSSCAPKGPEYLVRRTDEEGFGVLFMQLLKMQQEMRKTLLWTGVKVLVQLVLVCFENNPQKKICLVNKLYFCGGLTALSKQVLKS